MAPSIHTQADLSPFSAIKAEWESAPLEQFTHQGHSIFLGRKPAS